MSQTESQIYKVRVTDQDAVTVKVDSPCGAGRDMPILILAHGAHNDLDFPLLAYLASQLSSSGTARVVRFNFLYRERGLDTFDPSSVLEETFLRIYEHIRSEFAGPETLFFVGGKSLGARTAAELISRRTEGHGVEAAGLIELGYPLHSPERKDRLYLEPLRHIGVPSLFFAGTKDSFCDPELLRPVLERLKYPGTMYVLEDADHSLQAVDNAGQPVRDTYPIIVREVAAFIKGVAK